jgi:hypothetical protein
MIKGMNELLIMQKNVKEDQIKVLEFVQKKVDQE